MTYTNAAAGVIIWGQRSIRADCDDVIFLLSYMYQTQGRLLDVYIFCIAADFTDVFLVARAISLDFHNFT